MLHDVNQKAVSFMHVGAYSNAFDLLHSALGQLKTMVDTELSNQSEDEVLWDDAEAVIKPVPIHFMEDTENVAKNAFSFYTSAFVFAGSEAELKATSLNEVRSASVVLYNFGLCFHVHGVSRAASQAYFAKALHMYKTAVGLLEGMSELSSKAATIDYLLMLALYNNIGHICA